MAIAAASDRAALFRETGAAMGGISPVIIEKDFWVCWTLDRLFSELPHRLIFKGGTSLSKAYALIERFSEDIDLAFDRADLGFVDDRDPEQEGNLSHTQRRRLVDQLRESCRELIAGELLPAVREWVNDLDPTAITLEPDGETVTIAYPQSLDGSDYGVLDYVRRSVRLELGATSDHEPSDTRTLRPYAAETFPDLFRQPDCHVRVLAPERTFWEKVTLLHVEPDRPERSQAGSWQRLSRHVYDVHMLSSHGIAESAIEQLDLLDRVCAHKSLFFRRGWADYDSARTASIRVRPRGEFERVLRADYKEMPQMFFGDAPDWEEIVGGLSILEERIREALG